MLKAVKRTTVPLSILSQRKTPVDQASLVVEVPSAVRGSQDGPDRQGFSFSLPAVSLLHEQWENHSSIQKNGQGLVTVFVWIVIHYGSK